MLELLSLALFVVAVVAINKANGAIKENAALRAELERMRLHLEGEPAFKEDDSRHHPAADAGEVSNLAGHPQTSTASARSEIPVLE
jgi:hypothetical protein